MIKNSYDIVAECLEIYMMYVLVHIFSESREEEGSKANARHHVSGRRVRPGTEAAPMLALTQLSNYLTI